MAVQSGIWLGKDWKKSRQKSVQLEKNPARRETGNHDTMRPISSRTAEGRCRHLIHTSARTSRNPRDILGVKSPGSQLDRGRMAVMDADASTEAMMVGGCSCA
jgi:hypothetical protein